MNYPNQARGPAGGPPQAPPHPSSYGPPPQAGQLSSGEQRPWTRAGWGTVPVVLGTLLSLAGATAMNWTHGKPLLAYSEAHALALGDGTIRSLIGNVLIQHYVTWGMIAFILVWSAYVLGWTAGGVRGRTSAKLILSTPGRSVAAGRLGPMRALMAGYALLVAVGHALMINKSFYGDLFELEAGCWTVLAGQVVVAVGAAIGPRLPRR